jgi:hypothetical protein
LLFLYPAPNWLSCGLPEKIAKVVSVIHI